MHKMACLMSCNNNPAHLEMEAASMAAGAARPAALLVQPRLAEPVIHLPLLGVCRWSKRGM